MVTIKVLVILQNYNKINYNLSLRDVLDKIFQTQI